MKTEDQLNDVFKKSWKIFSNQFVTLLLATLIALVLMIFIVTIPPLIFGLYILCNNYVNGKNAKISDIFEGFKYFFRSWGLILVIAIGTIIGLILLIIPGILLMIVWQYAVAISIRENKGIIESLSKSYEIATKNFAFSAVLWILLFILGMIGSATRVGTLFTMPFSMLAVLLAVKSLSGSRKVKKKGKKKKK